MFPTFPLKSRGSWESCYAFNSGPAFKKMLICFASLWSWFIFSVEADNKLRFHPLTLEKPEHPQGRASSVCTILYNFKAFDNSSWELLIFLKEKRKKIHLLISSCKLVLPLCAPPMLKFTLTSRWLAKEQFYKMLSSYNFIHKIYMFGNVGGTELQSHGSDNIFVSKSFTNYKNTTTWKMPIMNCPGPCNFQTSVRASTSWHRPKQCQELF